MNSSSFSSIILNGIPLRAAALAFIAAAFLPVLPALAQAPASQAAQAAEDAPTAQAADAAPTEEPAATVESLDAQLRLLERKLEVKEEEEEKKRSESATLTAGKDGFSLVSADKESSLKFRFFQHIDGRYFFDDGANRLPNTLLIRRVRPVWEGTVAKVYNFRIMPEFSGTFQILDAYSEIAFWPQARLRVGKSKTPFGLERLKSSQDMDIIEFAHPTSLTPNYDLGISLLGDLLDESVSYYAGVFNGAVDGANRDADLNDDKDLIGRVFAHPFKSGNVELVRGLGIGFAASWGKKKGDSVNTDLAAYRTEGQQTFFSYRTAARDTGTVRAFGEGYRFNPQGYWYYGPFGLFGEYVASTQEYAKGGAGLAAPKSLTSTAWNATVNYVVTGESPSFKGLKPRHPLSFSKAEGASGWGALELVGRASQLKVDKEAFPVFANPATAARQATTYSAGLNWYLSRHLKWSASYAWTEFEGGATAAAGGNRPEEKVFFSRIQTAF